MLHGVADAGEKRHDDEARYNCVEHGKRASWLAPIPLEPKAQLPFPVCILSHATPMLGTQFVSRRYKLLHNVESAASQGPKPCRRKC